MTMPEGDFPCPARVGLTSMERAYNTQWTGGETGKDGDSRTNNPLLASAFAGFCEFSLARLCHIASHNAGHS